MYTLKPSYLGGGIMNVKAGMHTTQQESTNVVSCGYFANTFYTVDFTV